MLACRESFAHRVTLCPLFVCADLLAPTTTGVILSGGTVSPTKATTLHFSVSFSEPVLGVTTGSFAVASTGAGSIVASGLSGSGSGPYLFDVSGMTSNGRVDVNVKSSGSGIHDPSGNFLTSIGTLRNVTFGA
jgi:hypothetical protein